jgi:Uma2 family endonuclease
MTVLEHEQIVTAEDLWVLSHQSDDMHLELIEGVLYEMTPAGEEHGITAGNLFAPIWSHVRQHNLGRVTAAETGFILYKNPDPKGKDTVLAPDVGFISNARSSEPVKGYVPHAPDFAIEVVSPNDSYSLVSRKVTLYLRYGTRLIWIVDPQFKTVTVHTPQGARVFEAGETLDGGDVLPGFTLPVQDIFAR